MANHPNRSRRSDAPARSPTQAELIAVCARHGVGTGEIAALVYATQRSVQAWLDDGEHRRNMPAGLWELLLIKLGERVPVLYSRGA